MQFFAKKYMIASFLLLLAPSIRAEEPSPSSNNGKIYIELIRCEGHFKTSCLDLTKILGLQPKSFISEDELNALNSKLGQIGYYSEYSVILEPLNEPGHANLVFKINERSTGRNGVLVRGVAGTSEIPIFGQYNYTDTNFLGKGYFFNGSVSSKRLYARNESSSYIRHTNLNALGLEIATPFLNSTIGSVRLLTPHSGTEEILILGGLGATTGYNSAVTAYIGNAVGGNFTVTTEDNSFIPKTGAKLSATYLYAFAGKKRHKFGLDARANFPLGRISIYDGVLTFGAVSNPYLNPSYYSFDGQQVNNPFPEGGITYSLVRTENERRSAFYFGIGSSRLLSEENNLVLHAGYKAAFENLDLSLGFVGIQDWPK